MENFIIFHASKPCQDYLHFVSYNEKHWVVIKNRNSLSVNFIMKYWHNDGVVFGINSSLHKVMSAVIDLLSVSGLYSRDKLWILVTNNYSGFFLLPGSTISTTLVEQQLQNWLISIYHLSSQFSGKSRCWYPPLPQHLPCLNLTMDQCVYFLIPPFRIPSLYHS